MRDYTYQDMLRMQEEAAIRVREMKKRATRVLEDDTDQTQKKVALPDEVKHISYPVEIENSEKEDPEEKSEEHLGLLDLLTKDKDALLILSLFAVLSTGSNDYMTSCALLYLLL